MDVGLIVIAATFGLLVVSLVSFLSALARARRLQRFAGDLQEVQMTEPGASGPLDTSLEGLTVEIAADSPSAALLTPLRAGEWMPPAAPAPSERLAEVSLAERIAGFSPVPDIPEPKFALEQYEPWQVVAASPEIPVHGIPVSSGPELPLSATLPRVAEPAAQPSLQPSMTLVAASDDELDRELAALMPTVAFPAVSVPAPVPAVAPVAPEPVAPAVAPVAPEPVAPAAAPVAPEPVAPAVVVTPVPTAEAPVDVPPAPAPVIVTEPVAPVAAAPAPVVGTLVDVPFESPAVAPAAVAVGQPSVLEAETVASVASNDAAPAPAVAPPAPIPAPSPSGQVAEPDAEIETYWEDMLRVQGGAPSVRAEVRPPEQRPEVRIAATDVPSPAPPAPQQPMAIAGPRRARPVARVRGVDGAVLEYEPDAAAGPAEREVVTARTRAPELVMEAPVEMWFGDSRVGVKAGTATYDRFRKYADVLLEDLRASAGRPS